MNTKATKITWFNFTLPQMRAFHLSWIAFFLCFFGWFGIAPLTTIAQKDLNLTKEQIDNTIIASVAITILARLIIGFICDRVGPRLTYTCLLIIGSLPVMGIGFAHDYTTFLLGRLAIGAIGASFVVSQYHTSQMFASNCVGLANATTAGWGNMGAGVTNMLMPLVFSALLSMGISAHMGWRLAMIIPGLLMLVTGVAYYFMTQDTPQGNIAALRAAGKLPENEKKVTLASFVDACKDYRVWVLFLVYGACFGIEIIIHNNAARHFEKTFSLDLKTAGLIAGMFGGLAIFARGLGGYLSDCVSRRWGLSGRSIVLGLALAGQGIAMIFFANAHGLTGAVASLLLFGLFVHMSAGGTYALIPFINKKAVGSVAGIVGAGGNTGAVLAGFLFKVDGLSYGQALQYMGYFVVFTAALALLVRFSREEEKRIHEEIKLALVTSSFASAGQKVPEQAAG